MKTEIFSLLCVSGMGLYNAPKVFLDSFKNSHKIYFTIIFGYIGDAEQGGGYQTQDEGEEVETLISTGQRHPYALPTPMGCLVFKKDKIICVLIPASKALTPYSVRFNEVHIDQSVSDPASWKLPQGVRKIKNCKTQGTQETEARR